MVQLGRIKLGWHAGQAGSLQFGQDWIGLANEPLEVIDLDRFSLIASYWRILFSNYLQFTNIYLRIERN